MRAPNLRPIKHLVLLGPGGKPGQAVPQLSPVQRRHLQLQVVRSRKRRLLKRKQSSRGRPPGPRMFKGRQIATVGLGEWPGLVPGDTEGQVPDNPSGIARFDSIQAG